jgi:hypothetical protein
MLDSHPGLLLQFRHEREPAMSELDKLKEKIAYLKVWLGVSLVTDISLLGWLASHAQEPINLLLLVGFSAMVVVSVFVLALHRRIERNLKKLRDL